MPGVVSNIFLFAFGAAAGSFIGTLGMRYSARKGFKDALEGRSRCEHGGHELKWMDLIPIASFIFLGGRCRTCKGRISLKYPLIEAVAGLIALYVPLRMGFGMPALFFVVGLWTLLLISIVDLRLKLISDGLVGFVFLLGVGLLALKYSGGLFDAPAGFEGVSFLGAYYLTFRAGQAVLMNHLYALVFSLVLFGGIHALSKGKAMGLGDVKLAAALGPWLVLPDMVLAAALAFVAGSIVGLGMMGLGKLKFKSSVPFGPFIAAGVTLVVFFGYDIADAYFKIFGLL